MNSMSRRGFLHSGVAAMLAGTCSGMFAGCSRSTRRPLGIQLYTLREAMAEDVPGVLGALATIGYREVEFAGYFDHAAKAVRAMLDENGLSSPAAHIRYEAMQSDLDRTIEFAHTMGHEYLVIPYLQEEQRQTIDNYLQHAENFNVWGERCKSAGIRLAYHNHDFEFVPIDGRIPYDLLLQETDAELLAMEMDIYWISKAGAAPLEYFAQHPGRFPLWHIKDMSADGAIVDVGDGEIDFPTLFAEAELAGLRHGFVEHDRPDDAFSSAERSFQFLSDKW